MYNGVGYGIMEGSIEKVIPNKDSGITFSIEKVMKEGGSKQVDTAQTGDGRDSGEK